MKLDTKLKRQIRIQHNIFILLLLVIVACLAWLSLHFEIESDWTQNKRNTPSEASLSLLGTIEEPIVVKAFVPASNTALERRIQKVVAGFHRFKSNVELQIIDPISQPGLTREHNIHGEGETIVEYREREEKVRYLDEQSLTNAIHRLVRNSQKWIGFLEGHGERTPFQQGNYDYATLRQQLESKGFKVRAVNLADKPQIEQDTSVLVIADPQSALLPGELQIILDFIDTGGNLLWMGEPNSQVRVDELSEQLGIEFMPGMVVDLNVQLLGISDPRFVMVSEYLGHPITRNFDTVSLFPTSAGLEQIESEDWEANILLESLTRSWIEMDEIGTDEVTMDPGVDVSGPITIGITLSRVLGQEFETEIDQVDVAGPSELDDDEKSVEGGVEQRIVVVGDADFIADAYIGQGGNLDLSINIFNWLTRDDSFLSIPARNLVDQQLELSPFNQIFIGLMFLLVIPFGLLIAGGFVWWRRRRA
jgi:ABC-type uncharacterized transport system involved in gliding motility auxiliary subunit